jgi:hypothetical protein
MDMSLSSAGPLDQNEHAFFGATLLATCDNYHLPRENASYHLIILRGHLWGGRFQMAVIGEGQVTGGNSWESSD